MTLLEHGLSHRSPESPGGSARPLRGLAAQGGSFTIPNSHVVLGTGAWEEGGCPSSSRVSQCTSKDDSRRCSDPRGGVQSA